MIYQHILQHPLHTKAQTVSHLPARAAWRNEIKPIKLIPSSTLACWHFFLQLSCCEEWNRKLWTWSQWTEAIKANLQSYGNDPWAGFPPRTRKPLTTSSTANTIIRSNELQLMQFWTSSQLMKNRSSPSRFNWDIWFIHYGKESPHKARHEYCTYISSKDSCLSIFHLFLLMARYLMERSVPKSCVRKYLWWEMNFME